MNFYIPKSKSEIIQHLHDPLFKNSFFIILTSISGAGFGLIFWMLAAKLYPVEDVGIATALISSMGLLILISRFGLDFSIIRFFPIKDKNKIFGTSVIITTFPAILFGTVFIIGIDIFSPKLYLLNSPLNFTLFIVFLVSNSLISITSTSFIAIRKARFQLLQNIVIGSRILLIIPFITLGAIGIFSAIGISFILALLIAFILLLQCGIKPEFMIDKDFLNEAFHFSVGNYLVGLFMVAPNMIIPIMVLNELGAEQAAYYFIVFAIISILFMIPNALSTSLFVEGSHGEALKKTAIKSMLAIFVVMTPTTIILFSLANRILELIGTGYADGGTELLKIMIISSFFVGVNYVYYAIKRVQMDIKGIVIINSIVFSLLIGLSYIFIIRFGLIGVGYAWVLSYGVGVLVIIGYCMKRLLNID